MSFRWSFYLGVLWNLIYDVDMDSYLRFSVRGIRVLKALYEYWYNDNDVSFGKKSF